VLTVVVVLLTVVVVLVPQLPHTALQVCLISTPFLSRISQNTCANAPNW
jgi:hypothetical protein